MAGFAKCSRCNRALTSVRVEAVPALGALPASIVVCLPELPRGFGNVADGTGRVLAPGADFTERRSLRLVQAGDSRSARLCGDCSRRRGTEPRSKAPVGAHVTQTSGVRARASAVAEGLTGAPENKG